MISKDKQYRTRCGWEAVVLEISQYQVVFAYQSPELGWTTTRANKEGRLRDNLTEQSLDLIEVKPKQTIWFEVYRDEGGNLDAVIHSTKEDADRSIFIDGGSIHVDLFKKEYEL